MATRKKWLELAMYPANCAAVYFDVPADICKARAGPVLLMLFDDRVLMEGEDSQQWMTEYEIIHLDSWAAKRSEHPSGDLFSWGGAKIIDSHAKKLVPPTVSEGFQDVFVVKDLDDTNRLIVKFGGQPFPKESFELTETNDSPNDIPQNEPQPSQDEKQDVATPQSGPATYVQSKDFNLSTLMSRFNLNDKDCLNVYVAGSHLWG